MIGALGPKPPPGEVDEIRRLSALGLPPVSSREVLSTMLGVNPGIIWSLEHRTHRYYRIFSIPKGKGFRIINAPKIALKIVQKWISIHLCKLYDPPAHVFGFIKGRSHIEAAKVHCGAKWVLSVDIEDFFPSTPQQLVRNAFSNLGYGQVGAELLSSICCLRGVLAQGAPSSPILSNLVMDVVDGRLCEIAKQYNLILSRYADDIVLSGKEDIPNELLTQIDQVFKGTPWKLSPQKTALDALPKRLKVHGLLVHGDKIRLTKGYRNKVRALKHLYSEGRIKEQDAARVRGHIQYANQIEKLS